MAQTEHREILSGAYFHETWIHFLLSGTRESFAGHHRQLLPPSRSRRVLIARGTPGPGPQAPLRAQRSRLQASAQTCFKLVLLVKPEPATCLSAGTRGAGGTAAGLVPWLLLEDPALPGRGGTMWGQVGAWALPGLGGRPAGTDRQQVVDEVQSH
uniref:Uncharacterized protein n=1 Tax=Crocodylus porosus TaxID=8502 RepID=A0A7M4E3T6_CROPO